MSHVTMRMGSRSVVIDTTPHPHTTTAASYRIRMLLVLGALILPAACARQPQPAVTPATPPAGQTAAVRDLSALLESQVAGAVAQHPDFSAEAHLAQADLLKNGEQYQAAAVHYLAALRLRPNLFMARYQMACNLALWGKCELALDCLKRAVEEGFWGYELMKEDEDFENIRGDPAFQVLLAEVKERFAVEAPKHARDTIIEMPAGEPPPGGWPVLLFLHGYGAGNKEYAWVTRLAAANGFVGLAPCGLVMSPNFYGWPGGQAEHTHRYLQPLLEKYRTHKNMDLSRIYVWGFSQGATVVAGLVAAYPQTYAGAMALSPGGTTTTPPAAVDTVGPRRPLFVTSGRQESTFVTRRQKLLGDLWRKAGWPLREEFHQGGHEFPAGWDRQFPEVVRWLVEQNNQSEK